MFGLDQLATRLFDRLAYLFEVLLTLLGDRFLIALRRLEALLQLLGAGLRVAHPGLHRRIVDRIGLVRRRGCRLRLGIRRRDLQDATLQHRDLEPPFGEQESPGHRPGTGVAAQHVVGIGVEA